MGEGSCGNWNECLNNDENLCDTGEGRGDVCIDNDGADTCECSEPVGWSLVRMDMHVPTTTNAQTQIIMIVIKNTPHVEAMTDHILATVISVGTQPPMERTPNVRTLMNVWLLNRMMIHQSTHAMQTQTFFFYPVA